MIGAAIRVSQGKICLADVEEMLKNPDVGWNSRGKKNNSFLINVISLLEYSYSIMYIHILKYLTTNKRTYFSSKYRFYYLSYCSSQKVCKHAVKLTNYSKNCSTIIIHHLTWLTMESSPTSTLPDSEGYPYLATPDVSPSAFFSPSPSSFSFSAAAASSSRSFLPFFYFWNTMNRTPVTPLTSPHICKAVGILS